VGAGELRLTVRFAGLQLALRRLPVVLAVLGAFAAAAGAAQARPSDNNSPAMVISPNWAGYVAGGTTGTPTNFTSVTGTWTVPPATCGSGLNGTLSTEWVGLGGYTTQRQEEIGTDTNCDANGKPIYFAWFELVPFISYTIKGQPVQAGDTMTGLVKVLSPSLVQLQIQDQTRNWTWSRNITYSPMDTSTAEWITEAPATCLRFVCSEANLANFGTVTMRNISASTANGKSGTLTNPDWNVTALQLIPSKLRIPTLDPEVVTSSTGKASSPAGATPGQYSSDGSSFDTTWSQHPNPNI
jgi:hypothetical protein